MMELWRKRGWNEGEQHTDFRAEVFKWLKFLLSVVKLTDPYAPSLLKKFFGQKRHSIVTDTEFCQSVFDQVLEDTRRNFSILSIHQFCNLYKLFRVWPLNVSDSLFQQNKSKPGTCSFLHVLIIVVVLHVAVRKCIIKVA